MAADLPDFQRNQFCLCGWHYKEHCAYDSKCGLYQGMPPLEPSESEALADPYETYVPPEGTVCPPPGQASVLDMFWQDRERSEAEATPVLHTPPEFLPENSDLLDRACTNLVRDMIQDSKTRSTQVGGTHYTDMTIQPWDAARAWSTPEGYCGYHVITATAYLARHRQKGGLQDIKKALHHLTELVRYFEEDEEYPY